MMSISPQAGQPFDWSSGIIQKAGQVPFPFGSQMAASK